jgi:hypothetical protein
MEFLTQNWQTITAGVGALVMICRVIVKLTPTPTDDGWLSKVVSVLKAIGLKLD